MQTERAIPSWNGSRIENDRYVPVVASLGETLQVVLDRPASSADGDQVSVYLIFQAAMSRYVGMTDDDPAPSLTQTLYLYFLVVPRSGFDGFGGDSSPR